MSTHVIKRRAITTPSYRISSELRCFWFFFITGVALPRRVIQGFRAKKSPISSRLHTNAPVDNLLSNSIKLEKNAKNQTLNKGALPL